MDHIVAGRIDPTFLISHTLPLEQAAHGYEIFKEKKDNCTKVVLKPHGFAA
jgi:threonine dehydrogenase-like Zn-dependent dehydrogenase